MVKKMLVFLLIASMFINTGSIAYASDVLSEQGEIPATYQVKLDTQGGVFKDAKDEKTIELLDGDKYWDKLSTLEPEREGYCFLGWFKTIDGRDENKITENTEFQYSEEGNDTIYAHWKANEYAIFLYPNGGQLNGAGGMVVTYDAALPDFPEASWIGHKFNGWYTEAAADSGEKVETGSKYQKAENSILYAHWTTENYQVTFDPNGGEFEGEGSEELEVEYGEQLSEEKLSQIPVVKKTGYELEGWFNAAEGGEELQAGAYETAGDSTYYAHWKPLQYTLTFDPNGGEFEQEGSEELKVEYGETLEQLPEVKERSGYQFAGWYDAAEGGNPVQEGSRYETVDDSKLYAHWKENKYKIYFILSGETDNVSEISVSYNHKCSETEFPVPTKEGYLFTGWFTQDGVQLKAEDIYLREDDTLLFAHWKKRDSKKQDSPASSVPSTPKKELGKVTGVSISQNKKDPAKVTVSWKAVENAQKYTVYFSMKKKSGYKKIAVRNSGQKLRVTKKNLVRGALCYFKIVASMEQDGKEIQMSVIKAYTCVPKKLGLKLAKKGDQYRLFWGKMGKGVAGIEIYKNGKRYDAATGNSYTYYSVAKKNAPSGTKFKVRTYFLRSKKKVYSLWSNTVTIKGA